MLRRPRARCRASDVCLVDLTDSLAESVLPCLRALGGCTRHSDGGFEAVCCDAIAASSPVPPSGRAAGRRLRLAPCMPAPQRYPGTPDLVHASEHCDYDHLRPSIYPPQSRHATQRSAATRIRFLRHSSLVSGLGHFPVPNGPRPALGPWGACLPTLCVPKPCGQGTLKHTV